MSEVRKYILIYIDTIAFPKLQLCRYVTEATEGETKTLKLVVNGSRTIHLNQNTFHFLVDSYTVSLRVSLFKIFEHHTSRTVDKHNFKLFMKKCKGFEKSSCKHTEQRFSNNRHENILLLNMNHHHAMAANKQTNQKI